MGKLEGRVALITGGGSGIGAATGRLLAAEGAAIALAGIPPGPIDSVAEEINRSGGRALAIRCDVSRPEDNANAVVAAVQEFGSLDIVVPNAGIEMHREDIDLHTLPESMWDRTHDVNYRGVYLTCKYSLAQMVKQGTGGVITIVSSVAAMSGRGNNPAYAAGKTGLIGLGRHIGVKYAPQGIRCNIICPGALERTPDWDQHPNPEGRKQRLEARIPLGRLGKPEDIASFITFLSTEDASYATASTFLVDGGLAMS